MSLDGPPETHDAIRRMPRAFDLLAAGVAALHQSKPDFAVSARSTVQSRNCEHLRATVEAARGLGLKSLSFLAADVASEVFNRPGTWNAAAPEPGGACIRADFRARGRSRSADRLPGSAAASWLRHLKSYAASSITFEPISSSPLGCAALQRTLGFAPFSKATASCGPAFFIARSARSRKGVSLAGSTEWAGGFTFAPVWMFRQILFAGVACVR